MQSSLFSRYDPFSKAETLFSQKIDPMEGFVSIRPVWVIGDLAILYEWFDAPLRKGNWELNLKKMAVMQHYKRLLLSSDAQSFIVEQNRSPLMQIDLLPIQQAGLSSSIEYSSRDYAIHYLYRESFRDPNIFRKGMNIMLSYIHYFDLIRFIYVRLLKPDSLISSYLMEMGFESLDLHSFYGRGPTVYRLRIEKAQ